MSVSVDEEACRLFSVAADCLRRARDLRWGLLPDDGVLARLHAVEAVGRELFGVQVLLVDEVDQRHLATRRGFTSTSALLRDVLLLSAGEAGSRVAVARSVHPQDQLSGGSTPPVLPVLARAVESASIGGAQAGVIARGMNQLPAALDLATAQACEQVLVDQGHVLDPGQLRTLVEQIRLRVDPDGKLSPTPGDRVCVDLGERRTDGLTRFHGFLDDLALEVLRQAVDPHAAPTPETDGVRDTRPANVRRGQGLIAALKLALAAGTGPTVGGEHPHVTVFMTLHDLTGEPGDDADDRDADGAGIAPVGRAPVGRAPVGRAPVGRPYPSSPSTTYAGPISAATARRVACDARIIPIVLSGTSEILDVGRAQYPFPAAIRRAVLARDCGCAWPGCDRPPGWTEIHHITPWSRGGPTSLANGVAFCDHHHEVIHRGHWHVQLSHDGHPELIPPRWIDPDQQPRRNRAHDFN